MRKKKYKEIKVFIDPLREFYIPLFLGKKQKTQMQFMGEPINVEFIGDMLFIDLMSWFEAKRERLINSKMKEWEQ